MSMKEPRTVAQYPDLYLSHLGHPVSIWIQIPNRDRLSVLGFPSVHTSVIIL